MKKKLLGMILSAAMIVSVFAGGAKEVPAAEEDIVIGVDFFDWAIPLGVDIKKMLDYAADINGTQLIYSENKFDGEQTITNVENLFAAGCQAVIVCNNSDEQMAKIVQVAEKYNGKVFQYFRTLNDDAIREELWASPAYGGQVHEDEEAVGYHVGKQMADAGCKNVGLINFNVDDTTAINRQNGYVKALEENGVNIVAETWEVSTGEKGTEVTENYLASYPEMDGIAVVGGSGEVLYAVQNTLESYGKTEDIMVSTVDFYQEMTEDLESGRLGAIAGGHWCDPFFAYMLAFNYVNGNIPDEDLPVEVLNNMIFIGSVEDSAAFDEWFSGDVPPYNEEEIKAMTSVEDIVNAASTISLEDVISRHS